MKNASEQNTTETCVYRYYDYEELLLYIGVSKHPIHRFAEHRRDKWWHSQIHRIEVDWFSSKTGAHCAESAAISLENPIYNKTGAWKVSVCNYSDGLLFADILMDIRNNCDAETKEIFISVDDLVHDNSATSADVTRIVTWLSKAEIVRFRVTSDRSYWVLANDTRNLVSMRTNSWFVDENGKPRPVNLSRKSRLNTFPSDVDQSRQTLLRIDFSRKRKVRTYAN